MTTLAIFILLGCAFAIGWVAGWLDRDSRP
jgi:hypothetical protein